MFVKCSSVHLDFGSVRLKSAHKILFGGEKTYTHTKKPTLSLSSGRCLINENCHTNCFSHFQLQKVVVMLSILVEKNALEIPPCFMHSKTQTSVSIILMKTTHVLQSP